MSEIHIEYWEFTFSFARSSGPGGQSVNTANSKVILHWNIDETKSIHSGIIVRFKEKYPNLINDEGLVFISSQTHRSQKQNIDDCVAKIHELVRSVQFPPKTRKATKPKRSAVKKRLDSKRLHSVKKQNRNFKE